MFKLPPPSPILVSSKPNMLKNQEKEVQTPNSAGSTSTNESMDYDSEADDLLIKQKIKNQRKQRSTLKM